MSTVKMTSSYNKATTFVRPLLGYANSIYTNNYKNCYVEDSEDCKIYLVFHNTEEPTEQQVQTFNLLNNHPLFLSREEHAGLIIYKFSVDSDMYYDISKFLRGQYSQISDGGKQLILFSQHDTRNVDALASILWPTESDRNALSEALGECVSESAEIFSAPNLKDELFDKSKL